MASRSSASAAAAPLATPAFDLEQGDAQESGPEEISALYFYVYGFSLFIVVASIWAFVFPFSRSHLVASIVGSGGLVIGAFLILNTDLIVTYVRLLRETRRFRENNAKYEASLVKQKARVRELKQVEKALKTFEATCHGHMEHIQEELAELGATARDRVRQNIAGVLAITRPKQQDIHAGQDLQIVLQAFSNSYIHAFPMMDRRYEEMMKGLDASPRWQEVQSLSPNRLKGILVDCFFADIVDIKDIVRKKANASRDSVASGFFEPGEDETWAVQYEKTARRDGGAASVAQQGQQEQPAPQPPKRDSWAEAMAFAGLGK